MANVTVTLPADAAPIAGPLLLGYLFNWGLFGVLSAQVYLYHIAFPRDRWTMKTLVYGVYLVEMVQTILVTHDAFGEYARGFGNLKALNAEGLHWIAVPVFSGIVSATVQMHYAYRISILSGSRILGLGISVIALFQGSSAIAQGAQAFIVGSIANLATTKAFTSCAIWLAATAACDVIIAGCMTFFLLKHDSKLPETHALITKLVRLVIETGTLTALAATVDLALFLALPHKAYHGCVALTLAKLYSNSLLVIFNSRVHIVGGRTHSFDSAEDACNSTPAKSRPGAVSTIRFNPFATYASLGGVHAHEELRIETNSRSIQVEDQVRFYPSRYRSTGVDVMSDLSGIF
ncbi:uncharacterized protein PHACADRAFT_148765 [Phanerochaete carnosa HHB-10118-sp]|uniref:DUF6534 domain-containing protein n=1 Tax=Phanerochaete carnosa (strain HHB-10118-sp) TaxID=650164 RepID=K5W037_PHACS|nr:uncharacterized protein PHACADRAFT_148765 [Phanerochaete carnosa HHB-10118-sp]EKM52244.1 hypothetical protein PHACADRAFT_148765 [Phanerochaete carnosa HHB-10118-sp]